MTRGIKLYVGGITLFCLLYGAGEALGWGSKGTRRGVMGPKDIQRIRRGSTGSLGFVAWGYGMRGK